MLASACGAVAPQSRLMFSAVRLALKRDVDARAGAFEDARRDRARRSRWQQSRRRLALLERAREARADPRRTPRAGRVASISRPRPSFSGPASSSARKISASSSSSTTSSSFMPRSSTTLRPLSRAGLCDAETITPALCCPWRSGGPAPAWDIRRVGGRRRRDTAPPRRRPRRACRLIGACPGRGAASRRRPAGATQ